MKIINNKYVVYKNSILNYYEIQNDNPKLLMLHAQGTDSMSFKNVLKKLSKHFHIYLVDYYGHGGSSHNPEKYNLIKLGDDIISFCNNVIKDDFIVLGHSSGGLIAAYIAAYCSRCKKLILEDAPFFSCVGDERYNTYNYKDLSSVCHEFLAQDQEKDFVYYYFKNQYCWNFFPDKSREDLREKLSKKAKEYRERYPEKDLKVPFWPKKFLAGFKGLQNYDPRFGEAFYDDSFNTGVNYHLILSKVKCETLFMKANTTIGDDGLIQGALSEEHLNRVAALVKNMIIEIFDCGHGIHMEKPKQFVFSILHF